MCCTHRRNGRRSAPINVQRFGDPLIQQSFCSDVSEGLREVSLVGELGASSAWDRIHKCLLSSAAKVVGLRRRSSLIGLLWVSICSLRCWLLRPMHSLEWSAAV